jgi:hypothetical protein
MWSILFVLVISVVLLLLFGIALGKFCQLSNNDNDDFRQEWKELNRFPRAEKPRHFSGTERLVQQSKKIGRLDGVNQTTDTPGEA